MKKTYLARRNALISSANASWGLLALAFAVLVLLIRLLAPNFFWHSLTPAFRIASAITERSDSFFKGFSDAATLASTNEKLANENSALTLQNLALLEKMTDVSALAGFAPQKTASPKILAGVVARPPESPYDTLVLSAGTNDGITLDMEAFGEGGVPLGVVSWVTADFSRVTLFSSPGINMSGWIGKASLPVIIRGAGAGVMNASVARSAGIITGDIVFLPGPGMLPVGAVTRVDSDSSSPSVTLRITPTLNYFSISWVSLRYTGITFRNALSSTTPILP